LVVILLGRWNLLLEAISPAEKVKRKRGKKMTAKEKTKAAFEEEIKCHGLRQYSSYSLLALHFSFVLTWDSSTIPLSPLLMP
jgi:hypothetical protein